MKGIHTCYSFDELVEVLKACETLGLYYEVKKTIENVHYDEGLHDVWKVEIEFV